MNRGRSSLCSLRCRSQLMNVPMERHSFSPMGFYLGLFFKKLLLLTFSIFVLSLSEGNRNLNRNFSYLCSRHFGGQIENEPMDNSYFLQCVVLLVQTFWICNDIFLFLVVESFLNNESGSQFFTRSPLRKPTNERSDGLVLILVNSVVYCFLLFLFLRYQNSL